MKQLCFEIIGYAERCSAVLRSNIQLAVAVFMFLLPLRGYSQYYSLGNDPSSVKWSTVSSEHFRLIYPEGLDSLASGYVAELERAKPMVLGSSGMDMDRISVVLHPFSSYSNGMVTWTPRRMELFTIPPADGYSQSWTRQLALHEVRHIGQIDIYNTGLVKPFYWILGEQAPGMAMGVFASRWLLEGDAVLSETVFSDAGRGRDADFLQYYRAAFLSGDTRNWDRWRFGSFKHYTPNEYALGYLVNAATVLYSGKTDYVKVLSEKFMDNWYYMMYFCSHTYKEETGLTYAGMLSYGMRMFTDMWKDDAVTRGKTPFVSHCSSPGSYTDVVSPESDGRGNILALRSGMSSPAELISIDGAGNARHLRFMSSGTERMDGRNGTVFWCEKVPDLRWSNVYFSDLFRYDCAEGRSMRLSEGKYYFNPHVSSDGERVYVAEYCPDGKTFAVCLDSDSGELVSRMEMPFGVQVKEISEAFGRIAFTAIGDGGLGLYAVDSLASGSVADTLVCEQSRRMDNLEYSSGLLYFDTDFDGVNNIYAVDSSGVMYAVTNSMFGAKFPEIADGRLYCSDYTHKGYTVASVPADSVDFVRVGPEDMYSDKVADRLSGMYATAAMSCDTVSVGFSEPEKYRKGLHLFRFHSWAPFYYDVDRISSLSFEHFHEIAMPGIILISQNNLSTAQAEFGYSYFRGFHAGHVRFTYTGWYPVIELSADINQRNRMTVDLADAAGFEDDVPYVDASLRTYLPLNLSSGGWSRGLVPQFDWLFTNDRLYDGGNLCGYLQKMVAGVRYYSMLPVTKAGIFPRYGYSVSAYLSHMPFRNASFSPLLYMYAYGYLPGFAPDQGLRLSFSAQMQFAGSVGRFLQQTIASFPRGYRDRPSMAYAGFTADYAVPVYLGDVSLDRYVYFKRLQLIPFFDYGYNIRNRSASSGEHLFSIGADILLDCNLFHVSWPVSLGMRYSWTTESAVNCSLLFSISIE